LADTVDITDLLSHDEPPSSHAGFPTRPPPAAATPQQPATAPLPHTPKTRPAAAETRPARRRNVRRASRTPLVSGPVIHQTTNPKQKTGEDHTRHRQGKQPPLSRTHDTPPSVAIRVST